MLEKVGSASDRSGWRYLRTGRHKLSPLIQGANTGRKSDGPNLHLNYLEMQAKVKEMDVNRLHAEVINERRLDSIGSGTGERVREAEFAYETGRLQLEQ